jgi:FKBP-type peptidyl-prolyl cis-trans isomerase
LVWSEEIVTLTEHYEDLSALLLELSSKEARAKEMAAKFRKKAASRQLAKAVEKFAKRERVKKVAKRFQAASAKKAGLVKGYEFKGGKKVKNVYGRWVKGVNPDSGQPVFIDKRRYKESIGWMT